MSSHKEAPGISKDPAADNTDVYAFVSPDKPSFVTLIANFVPLEDPAGGPNFFEFGDDVLYEIHIDNDGDGRPNVTYQFQFNTKVRNENTFLYNTGPITSLDSPAWNRRQFYSVTKVLTPVRGAAVPTNLGTNLACPPCNIGPSSTPDYQTKLAGPAIHNLGTAGGKVFAGQRAEGFYVDLGAIFDLGILRPFLAAHLAKMPMAPGINSLLAKNIHTIAIQVPKSDLLATGANGTTVGNMNNVIGVYASASRQKSKVFHTDGSAPTNSGTYQQVSRLAGPLVNEVLISIDSKDKFNSQDPVNDSQFLSHFSHPELAGLLPVLYPGVFPNLAKYKSARADIEAIFLTGIPASILPNSPTYTGTTQAELLRLNVAVAPTTSKPSNLGLIGGDNAGFPNGRRVFDDVTTIELRALAGATIPLVDPSYKPDKAAGAITPGLTSSNTDVTAKNTVHYLDSFPYLGTPHDGYDHPANNDPASDLGAINAAPDCPVPVGAPQTGIGPHPDSNTGLLVGSGVALAGVAAAAGVAARSRMATAGVSAGPELASRPRPRTASSSDGIAERNEEPGE